MNVSMTLCLKPSSLSQLTTKFLSFPEIFIVFRSSEYLYSLTSYFDTSEMTFGLTHAHISHRCMSVAKIQDRLLRILKTKIQTAKV